MASPFLSSPTPHHRAGHTHSGSKQRPTFEVADILRAHLPDSLHEHSHPLHVHKVLSAIQNCRTAALGGHIDYCTDCGTLYNSYNSCRDRHCPKCQGLEKARWIEARKDELLPVPYFHTVFTLPHAINDWVGWNDKLIYDLLFASATDTLQAFAARHWNGTLGITAVLHTWGQTMERHIHLHCIVPGGALTFDGEQFKPCPHRDWLFPVKALSKVFRGNYLERLERAHAAGELKSPPGVHFAALRKALREYDWVVYAKPPFGGPQQLIDYLGRYTQRIAISNHRILSVADGKVTFTWKDDKHGAKSKEMTLDAHEFIRRFILHILPPRFTRIRHDGLLACGHRASKRNRVKALLGLARVTTNKEREPYDVLLQRLGGKDIHVCPFCGGRLRRHQALAPTIGPSRGQDPPLMHEAA
ncbi:MAG: IS91 family transposase [Thiohalocapsa sp. PB-PSB1]|jgi:hypothetical protein|nr:MAG: IS91 family transposase [Thiohalocapsa sp. PB-PSB1]